MTRVEIDLNIRVRGNWTLAGLEHADGPVSQGDSVEVYEPESGVTGPGRIEEVDNARRVIFLSVDWGALQLPGTSLAQQFGAVLSFNRSSGVAAGVAPNSWPQAVRSSRIACSA